MKKLSLLLACGLAAGTLQAQERTTPMLDQGTQELGLSGVLDWHKIDKIDFDLDLTYGYFIRDGWELGGRVVGSDVGGVERFEVSGFTEYNFNRETNMVPFVGASVGIADISFPSGGPDVETTLGPDGDATVFTVQGGIKWFLRPYMAISTAISFSVSSDDVFGALGFVIISSGATLVPTRFFAGASLQAISTRWRRATSIAGKLSPT